MDVIHPHLPRAVTAALAAALATIVITNPSTPLVPDPIAPRWTPAGPGR
jgi:hypothetical protein